MGRGLIAGYTAFVVELIGGCNVYPTGTRASGITNLDEVPGGDCGRGFLVVESDYDSSNVSAVDSQGELLSASLVSSGMTSAGLSEAFSGDVVFPSELQSGDEAIVINRYPQSVVSLLDLRTARVLKQLDVSTGFAANPHDASRLGDGRVIVARFDTNLASGEQPFDAGGDLVVVDPALSRILERIDLRALTPDASATLLPHPERILRVGTRLFVIVSLYTADDRRSGSSYLVSFDALSLEALGSLKLGNFSGCAGLSLSPNETELAVSCTGAWNDASRSDPGTSGLLGIDIRADAFAAWSFKGSELSPPQPFNFFLAYAGPHHVVAMVQGQIASSSNQAEFDRLIRYDTESGVVEEAYRVTGPPFSLGDVRCLPKCGRCAVSDASRRSTLLLFQNTERGLELQTDVPVDAGLGLPTRWLGVF
jgi:hypothetical protein